MREIFPAAGFAGSKGHEGHAKSGYFRSAGRGVFGDVKKRCFDSVMRLSRGVSNEVLVGFWWNIGRDDPMSILRVPGRSW